MPGLRIAKIRKGLMKKGGKRPTRRPTVNVNRALAPFAQRYITKMKYSEQIILNGPTGGGLNQFTFNLNSVFDPNRTGTGHKPYGYTTMAAIYNRYRVIKCNYVISALATGASTGDGYGIVAALPSNEVVAITGGVAQVQENPRCKYITQAPNAALKVLKGSIHLPSLVGRSKSQYMADDRYQALYNDGATPGTNPNELAILNIFSGLLNGTAETINTRLNVVLEFVVESFDMRPLPQTQ